MVYAVLVLFYLLSSCVFVCLFILNDAVDS